MDVPHPSNFNVNSVSSIQLLLVKTVSISRSSLREKKKNKKKLIQFYQLHRNNQNLKTEGENGKSSFNVNDNYNGVICFNV